MFEIRMLRNNYFDPSTSSVSLFVCCFVCWFGFVFCFCLPNSFPKSGSSHSFCGTVMSMYAVLQTSTMVQPLSLNALSACHCILCVSLFHCLQSILGLTVKTINRGQGGLISFQARFTSSCRGVGSHGS